MVQSNVNSCKERLKECDLSTLETRRLRGDQIEFFKILNRYENIDITMFFSLKKDNATRGHEVTLEKDHCRLGIIGSTLSHRGQPMNGTDNLIFVTASSVKMFKHKVDTYFNRADYA